MGIVGGAEEFDNIGKGGSTDTYASSGNLMELPVPFSNQYCLQNDAGIDLRTREAAGAVSHLRSRFRNRYTAAV